jgi:hypothetical protein
MAQTKYTYSIAGDTLNGVLSTAALKEEIGQSSIITALDYITALGDVLDIYMKDVLSEGDETTLDGVVSAHTGVPLEGEPQIVDLSTKTPGGKSLIAVKKADGLGGSKISHDWTDPCTWYQESSRVTGETLTGSGVTWNTANPNVIDLTHGRVSDEDDFSSGYLLKVYDDAVEQTEGSGDDYTFDYATGTVTFASTPTGPVTADYSYATDSTYTVSPDEGKILSINRAELQFSKNVSMGDSYVDFEIWVYNPYDLPNKILYKRKRYKNIKDIINGANLGQGVIPAISGLSQDILVFPFDYVTTQDLKYSQGTELRIKINDDAPFSGEWATVTIYFNSETE